VVEFVIFNDDGQHLLAEFIGPNNPTTNVQLLENRTVKCMNLFQAMGTTGMALLFFAFFSGFVRLLGGIVGGSSEVRVGGRGSKSR